MLTHCLAIHHTDLINCIGVLLQFMLPVLVQLPGTGVSLHQVCTTHRAGENQWKYLQIDNHCFSKSRLALLLAIFDTASFKTLALDQEHEKPQQDYTERAPCSLKRRLVLVAASEQPAIHARPQLISLPPPPPGMHVAPWCSEEGAKGRAARPD